MKSSFPAAEYAAPVLLFLCICAGLAEVLSYTSGKVSPVTVTVGTAVSLIFAAAISRIPNKLKEFTVYRYRRLTLAMCVALLISQIAVAMFCGFEPKNDLSYICSGAENLVRGRDLYCGFPEEHRDYFAVYPNNHMIFLAVYLLYSAEYSVTGNISDVLPTIVNIMGLSISYWLMCRCAEFIYPPERALVCAVRGYLFTPFMSYAAFFYTDSLAMPLVMTAVYFYLIYRRTRKISRLALCGFFLALAFRMKGSSAIILIAVIMDMAAGSSDLGKYLSIFLPCIAVCKTISAVCLRILRLKCDELREKSFPLIHWIMMSADGRGGYVREDFLYTKGFSGCAKVSADLSRLWDKLERQGISGFLAHLAEKSGYTWGNCTFMAGYYYSDSFRSPIFYAISFLCHFTVLFSVLLSLLSPQKQNRVFRLVLSGGIIFFLIWEARCRYLVSLFPLLMLC